MTEAWSEPGLPRRALGLSSIDGDVPSAAAVETAIVRPARRWLTKNVVDQLWSTSIHTRQASLLRNEGGRDPHPVAIAVVWAAEADRADLRAGRAVQDLRGRRVHFVVHGKRGLRRGPIR